ncbi:unnamed protein product [Moneuplotes crassus]|uniref:Uncharacterized protein n=1 Tax=Euplotes crassus TaxID=5936 RepID=A0AAD1UDL0_EUPCR|nr:unnamed protein product [Moneuplotes crassus]
MHLVGSSHQILSIQGSHHSHYWISKIDSNICQSSPSASADSSSSLLMLSGKSFCGLSMFGVESMIKLSKDDCSILTLSSGIVSK